MIPGNKNGPARPIVDVRILYSILLYLLLPVVLLRLLWKSRRLPAYRDHCAERLGFALPRVQGATWVHAVSVGEVRAAAALIESLLQEPRAKPVLITTTTPMGRETAKQLFGERAACAYLPYDLPGVVRRFLDAIQPTMAIFVELELWPNMFAGLADRGVPLYLVNARLSEHSFAAYRKSGGLVRNALAKVTRIAAQTETDRQRFVALGASPERVTVSGNLKSDARLPPDFASTVEALQARIGAGRETWLAASTHPGEETLCLEAHRQVLADKPGSLLILAPRHPERADALMAVCRDKGLYACQYSESDPVDPAGQVLIVDRIGVLVYLYGVSPVAFIGGSLVDQGGHNPVEAMQSASAVIHGPYTGNFADLYARLHGAAGATQVATSDELALRVGELLSEAGVRRQQTERAHSVFEAGKGALGRTLELISPNG